MTTNQSGAGNSNKINKSSDLSDSKKDQGKMKQEEINIILPEIKDIPGQENIRVPDFREMQDTTISSADEEGEGLLDDLNEEETDEEYDDNSNVTRQEKKLLRKSASHPSTDESDDLENMSLDSTDKDGEKLNEKSLKEDKTGADLDVPGTELDDEDEDNGSEDEENNLYSQRD